MTREKYWTVIMEVFAFDTEEAAREYAEKIVDAFCEMPESAEYASYVRVRVESA